MTVIEQEEFEGERPLFKSKDLFILNCDFLSGESALKESSDIIIAGSHFSGKYPLWHNLRMRIEHSLFSSDCRAPIWYSKGIEIDNCTISAPKFLRDSEDITIINTMISGMETLWNCKGIEINNSSYSGDYFAFYGENIEAHDFMLKGDYSFQKTEDLVLENCRIESKDTLWNSKNVTVYNSILYGAYLGWYSKNLTLINCIINGTQPLCYSENLILKNCEMIDTDLCFEYSELYAEVNGSICSIRNPIKGRLEANEIGTMIFDDPDIDQSNTQILISIGK